jgi:hypothetical protein
MRLYTMERIGWLIRAAGSLTERLPLVLRIFSALSFGARVASVCFIPGAFLSRHF